MAGLPEPLRHLLHVFSTFAVGGPQTRFVSLANALGPAYRHAILAMDNRHGAAAGLAANVDFSLVTMPVRKSGGLSLANMRAARALLRRLKPDLLVTYNWGTIEWGLANIMRPLARHVHVEDGFGPEESPTRQLPRRVLMRRVALARAARVVVPSRTLFDVATRIWHLPQARLLYLPNGIDCAHFAGAPDRGLLASLGIGVGDKVVGTVAVLRPEKNLGRLLRVFAMLPEALVNRLVIVGDGPERASLAEAAQRLGIAARVVFTGALADPARVLGRLDVFALSSDTEQMPNTVLEAMASGRPIVATNVGDIAAMVAPANGAYVVPAQDETAFAAALTALLTNDAKRLAIGNDNRDHVRTNYELSRMVARWDALFAGAGGDG